MALIAMAVYDTEENKRTELTVETLDSIGETVNSDHRVIVVDNNSCAETKDILNGRKLMGDIELITLPENIGTAAAINLAWKQRRPGEHCIKMDNDIVVNCSGWVEQMEEVIERFPSIGQIGLKRKDCTETTTNTNSELRSVLYQLPHKPGERWIVVEKAKHIIGSCVMHNSRLLDKIGYLYQPGLYAYDDVLMSWRCNLAGFITCFLPHIDIDHIDPGGTEYCEWKQRYAGQYTKQVSDIVDEYISGKRPLYYQ